MIIQRYNIYQKIPNAGKTRMKIYKLQAKNSNNIRYAADLDEV